MCEEITEGAVSNTGVEFGEMFQRPEFREAMKGIARHARARLWNQTVLKDGGAGRVVVRTFLSNRFRQNQTGWCICYTNFFPN